MLQGDLGQKGGMPGGQHSLRVGAAAFQSVGVNRGPGEL